MLKKSREMDETFAWQVMCDAPYATIAMTNEDGTPYCIPVSIAVKGQSVYFHCALKGQKLDCMVHQPMVCLSAVSSCEPTVGPKDNSFTLQYKSAVAFGKATIVEDDSEKIDAFRLICERYLPHHMAAFDAAIARSLKATKMVRIDVTQISGKRKQYDAHGDEMKFGRME